MKAKLLAIVLILTVSFVIPKISCGCYYDPPPYVDPAPYVTLTYPVNKETDANLVDAVFTTGGNIAITANAWDNGVPLVVQFYANGTLLGSDNNSPYSFNWNDIPTGSYTVKVRAIDNTGQVTDSELVKIAVRDLPDASIIGTLFAGIGPSGGAVYQYLGGSSWLQTSPERWHHYSPDDGNGLTAAVMSLCEYNGELYAGAGGDTGMGVGCYTTIPFTGGKTWKYNGTDWTKVSAPDEHNHDICGTCDVNPEKNNGNFWSCGAPYLASFQGDLYAAMSYSWRYPDGWKDSARLYKLNGNSWTKVFDTCDTSYSWLDFRSVYAWNGSTLCIGGWGPQTETTGITMFGHFNGTTFITDYVSSLNDANAGQVHDYIVYDSNLYASVGDGDIYRSEDGISWVLVQNMKADNDNFSYKLKLETFQGQLYMTQGLYLKKWTGSQWIDVWKLSNNYYDLQAPYMTMTKTGNILILGVANPSQYHPELDAAVYVYDGNALPLQLISEPSKMGPGATSLILYGE